jgi:5-methylcytosine-specific restriction enzyme subunit McrC
VSIPIRNLYYVFLYAWSRFSGGRLEDTGVDDAPDLPNLFARLLLAGTRRVLRRGLDRGYKSFTSETLGPRGHLRLDRIIKEVTQLRGTAICEFDELTHNVLHNRILKATIASLTDCADVAAETRHDLRSTARLLFDVEDIRLSASDFHRVVISRNNREYVFLMRLCDFVFWSLCRTSRARERDFRVFSTTR